MWIPFRNKADAVFRRDYSIWTKMACAALVAGFVITTAVGSEALFESLPAKLTPRFVAILLLGSAALGACLALGLSLKDVVQRRAERSARVNPILRLYFAMGVWSLIAWFFTILLAALLITIVALA